MNNGAKYLSNPFSTGGGGPNFEVHVQASFVALMLTGGFAPCLPCHPINKIKLQGKFAGYKTDDLIVFVQDSSQNNFKLIGQIKHSINLTKNDNTFAEVIKSAWQDFNNTNILTKGKDIIALITGPLKTTDINDTRFILEWARQSENSSEFFQKINLAKFSSEGKRRKLSAFKATLRKANNNNNVSNDEIFDFLRHFHILGYDLDIKAGVTIALLHSLIGQYSPNDVKAIWATIVEEVQYANQNAGTINIDNISEELLSLFKRHRVETIPEDLVKPHKPKPLKTWSQKKQVKALTVATLLGKWEESNEADLEIIMRLIDGL